MAHANSVQSVFELLASLEKSGQAGDFNANIQSHIDALHKIAGTSAGPEQGDAPTIVQTNVANNLLALLPEATQPEASVIPSDFFKFAPLGVSTSQLMSAATIGTPGLDSPTASPVAAGFPLFRDMVDLTLRAEASRRAGIDQEVSIAQLMIELERASPTRAASLSVALGLPNTQDFSFTKAFGGSRDLPAASGGFFGGNVGGQNVSLPQAFSGRELSFLGSNPGTAGIVQDIADRFGLPDIFSRSTAGLVPTSRNLLQVAA